MARNPHLPIENMRLGVKEDDLSAEEIESSGLATSELVEASKSAPKGSIGNAHSMFHALRECAEGKEHYLVLEDDAIIHPEIVQFLADRWSCIESVDFLALGANTDAVICFEPVAGMKFSGLYLDEADRHPGYERIGGIFNSFSKEDVGLHKVHNMFGTCAYLVSPAGARKLLEKAFPLDMSPIEIPLLSHRLLGISFDRRINAFLGEINAQICMPFMAMTPNDSKSAR
jgi:glycosyl transferase, family 25